MEENSQASKAELKVAAAALLRIIEPLLKATREQFIMNPEGESTKPEDEDGDTEDLEWDKTEGDETSVKQTDDEGA